MSLSYIYCTNLTKTFLFAVRTYALLDSLFKPGHDISKSYNFLQHHKLQNLTYKFNICTVYVHVNLSFLTCFSFYLLASPRQDELQRSRWRKKIRKKETKIEIIAGNAECEGPAHQLTG